MAKLKTGKLSQEDMVFITNSVRTLSIPEIATKLRRTQKTIQEYIDKNIRHASTIDKVDHFNLQARAYWSDIEKQFSKEELKLFEYHWNEIIKQFNKDVIHTEELQIVDVVRHEILCSRVLKERQETAELVARTGNLLVAAKEAQNDEEVFALERQIAVLRASMDTMSKDFKTYQEQKNKLFDKIKGSRDQRVSKIEDHKETFAAMVLRLKKDPEFIEQCSLDMEKMRLSMEKHLRDLGDYLEYGDNTVDKPILNETTVFFGEDNE